MTKQLMYVIRYLLGRDLAGRSVSVFPDDTFIVSFPRSGNTWMRFLVSNIVHPAEDVSFQNVDKFIPEISETSKKHLNSLPRPRILKSHEYLDLRYPRVIYLVRDPRDVAVSGYHFFLKRNRINDRVSIHEFVRKLLRREFWEDFGTWAENVGGWLGARFGTENFLLIRYEDMLAQTKPELAKVAALLSLSADSNLLERAIERSNFGEMQKLEKVQSDKWFMTKESRKDIPFVRGGTAGGWRSTLPEDCVALIEGEWGHLISYLGYELVSGETPRMSFPVASSIFRHSG